MKRTLLFIVSFLLFFSSNMAQLALKMGPVKYEKILFSYPNPPLEKLSNEIKTYQVIINPGGVDFQFIRYVQPFAWTSASIGASGSSNYGSVELAQNEFINLPGFIKVDENPDFIVEINLREMVITKKNMIVSNAGCYYYILSYNYGAEMKVYDKDGAIMLEKVYKDYSKTYSAGFGGRGETEIPIFREKNDMTFCYKTLQELEYRFSENYHHFPISLTRKYLFSAEALLQSMYTFNTINNEFLFAYSKTTKKANYDATNEALEYVQKGVSLLNSGGDLNSYQSDFNKAIALWESQLKEIDYADKTAIKLAPMLYVNIATISIFLEYWDKVTESLKTASELDPSYNIEYWVAFSEERKHRLSLHK